MSPHVIARPRSCNPSPAIETLRDGLQGQAL